MLSSACVCEMDGVCPRLAGSSIPPPPNKAEDTQRKEALCLHDGALEHGFDCLRAGPLNHPRPRSTQVGVGGGEPFTSSLRPLLMYLHCREALIDAAPPFKHVDTSSIFSFLHYL